VADPRQQRAACGARDLDVEFDARVVLPSRRASGGYGEIVGVSDDLDRVALREAGAGKTRAEGKCGAFATLLSRCDHPQANKGAVVLTLSKCWHSARADATIGDMRTMF